MYRSPDLAAADVRILRAIKAGGYGIYAEVWTGHNLTGEPLVDAARLDHDNVLSVLILAEKRSHVGERNIAVLDFQL
jgi:hypothetical protein